MSKPIVERVTRGRLLSPEEAERYREIRKKIIEERSEIDQRIVGELGSDLTGSVVEALQLARLERGLSLEDVSHLTGLNEETLAGLESGSATNPSFDLLKRYAHAVGKRIRVSIEDEATEAR